MIVRCTWERVGGAYRAWAVKWPQDAVESPDWREIEFALFDKVLHRIDGCEWTVDWDPTPPLPIGFPGNEVSDFVLLAWDGRAAILSDPSWLYTEGLCSGCESPRGARTVARAHVHLEDPGELMCAQFSRPLGVLFCTGSMLQRLPAGIRDTTEFRVCELVPLQKCADDVYEVMPRATAPWVAARDSPATGWRCRLCGAESYLHTPGTERFQFVAARDVQFSAEGFWVGPAFAPSLCVARTWWERFRETKAGRRFTATPLYTLEDRHIDSTPTLRARELETRPATPQRLLLRRQRYAETHGLTLPSQPCG